MESANVRAGRGVSVVVPCLNESGHIERFLANLTEQQILEYRDYEFIIADGGSDDGTLNFIQNASLKDKRIRLLHNEGRTASAGMNVGIKASFYDIILRMDVHTEYADDYIRKCVEILEKTGADNVGGPARTKAKGYIQEAVRLAYHSWFSVGGALFHNENHEGYVDTVTYGCWKKETLLKMSLFDEQFQRNEDDELNLRIIRQGGKIWQSTEIRSWYYPRDSIALLFKQYLQYGYWKVLIFKKHKLPASYRHMVPATFILALIYAGLLCILDGIYAWGVAALAASYSCANIAAGIITCRKRTHLRFMPVMPMVFGAYHFGYGWGFLMGLVDFMILKRSPREHLKKLTRRKINPKLDLKRNPPSKLSAGTFPAIQKEASSSGPGRVIDGY